MTWTNIGLTINMKERDTLLYTKNLIESKAEALREKYEVSQKSWLEARYELDLKETIYSTNEATRKQLEQDLSHYKMVYLALREQVADLLSEENSRVRHDDKEILEKLAAVMTYTRDRARVNS
jgi:glutamine synthetase type III